MVEFLRTNKIASHIEDITVDAKEHITFVTPYLKFPKILYERLVEKDNEGVKIRFVYGKVELQKEQEQLLRKLKNISIYFLENLHAKCYINESAGIVTSMNLHDFSEKNNREMGIFFKRTDNESLYTQVNAEVESIIKAATPKQNSYTGSGSYKHPEQTSRNSHPPAEDNPSSLTYNQRLLEKLKQEFRYSNFEYVLRDDKIVCNDFGEFFRLEVEPKGSYYRIDFRLAATDYNIRNKQYDILYGHRYEIEKHFPRDVVNWGNQMLRIKFDFPQECSALQHMDEQVYLQWIKKANQTLHDMLKAALKYRN